MNSTLLRLAVRGATDAYNYLRNSADKREREVYDALLEAVKNGRIGEVTEKANIDQLETLFSNARAEAGDVTRDIHDRLDRRRAAFAAAAPDRKARREALGGAAVGKKGKPAKKKSKAGKVVGGLLGTAGLAAAGWALWEFVLAEKLDQQAAGKPAYTPEPTRTETGTAGTATLVYSTRTEDDYGKDDYGKHAAGPLGEDPAERDEELLASIDEQLTTLDALDDDQREATAPRHQLREDD
ncbi:hypothetical protein [Corynebacterium sp. HMSC29G08]|uniref:hypothetical protein n=1 Tax=Corynebacterium sp. HMSC29G08 TaxID=1581069 RepID=UPI0008A64CC4|nr:hypothetical protein [Corynebacterium sp. HMSC29G08]OFT84002.1 hypothetical protein HMPREF3101_04940 [Corynebacterium sp. HMSC29G08]